MSIQSRCPVCSSENVYTLLNTLHCKRCGNIWKEERKNTSNFEILGYDTLTNNQHRLMKRTSNMEKKMEMRLNEYLRRFNGKFSLDKVTWKIGDIQMAMFRSYLKKCVNNRTLIERKDDYGIIWYSRSAKKGDRTL